MRSRRCFKFQGSRAFPRMDASPKVPTAHSRCDIDLGGLRCMYEARHRRAVMIHHMHGPERPPSTMRNTGSGSPTPFKPGHGSADHTGWLPYSQPSIATPLQTSLEPIIPVPHRTRVSDSLVMEFSRIQSNDPRDRVVHDNRRLRQDKTSFAMSIDRVEGGAAVSC